MKLPTQEAKMLKHIGKHGDRKVAIIFREIPDETHMALVLYTETMPVAMHDSLIKVIESQKAIIANEPNNKMPLGFKNQIGRSLP